MTLLVQTFVALTPLSGAALAGDGWTQLELPRLCLEAPAIRPTMRLEDGSHLVLESDSTEREIEETPALPVSNLLGWLEDDAGRRKLAVHFLPSAPPLMARGDDAALASVRATLAELDRAEATRAIALRAWWLEGPAELATTRPDRATFTRLVGEREPWAARSARSGELVALGERSRKSYLASYSVEVATDSGVADPELGAILTGRTLHVRACRLRGGAAVHVEGFLDVAELAGLATYKTDAPDLGGVIEVPTVDALQVAFGGVIDNGGVLAVTIHGAHLTTPDLTLLLEARTSAEAPSDGGAPRLLRSVDLAWIESQQSELPLPVPGFGVDFVRRLDRAPLREGISAATVAQLADDVGRGPGRAPRSPALWIPGFLIGPSDDTAGWNEIDQFVAACEREATTAELSLIHGELRVLAPITPGLSARVLAGSERTVLVDYDVQVAQQSWMPSPRVEHVLDGVLLQGHLDAAGLTASAWVASSGPAHDLERKDLGIGRMQLLDRACLTSNANVRRGAARATLIPASARTPALSVELREK